MATKLLEIRENQKEIAQIAKNTQEVLDEMHNITITDPSGIPTIAYRFIEQAIKFLNEKKEKGKDIEINLMQLLDIGISHRSSDGEKDGNFTPYVNPGQEFKLLVKTDNDTEADE